MKLGHLSVSSILYLLTWAVNWWNCLMDGKWIWWDGERVKALLIFLWPFFCQFVSKARPESISIKQNVGKIPPLYDWKVSCPLMHANVTRWVNCQKTRIHFSYSTRIRRNLKSYADRGILYCGNLDGCRSVLKTLGIPSAYTGIVSIRYCGLEN